MSVRRSFAVVAVLVSGLALAGCATSADSASGAASGGAPVLQEDAAPQPAAPGVDDGAVGAYGGTGGDRAGDAPGSVARDRSVVVVASTTVRVEDVPAATDRLATLVAGAGGRIEAQQVSRGEPGPYPVDAVCEDASGCLPAPPSGYAVSTTTVRLDPAAVDGFLRSTAALGTVVTGSRSSTDVSAEVADVDARVSSAEASLARVRALLTRAESIADVVALEAELARRQADLEALQARQRVLGDQTAEATVTVALVEAGAPVPAEPETGFLAGLRAGWDAFTSATVVGLTVLGAVLPFAVLAAVIALVAWLVVRRTRRATPAAGA